MWQKVTQKGKLTDEKNSKNNNGFITGSIAGTSYLPHIARAVWHSVLCSGIRKYVQKKAPNTIIEGEIITFLTNQSKNRVTHRVIKSDPRRKVFVTKGDANRQKDASLVSWENVCGVEIGCVPYAGYVLEFLNNWKGKAAAVCFFLVLLLISEALTVRREVLQKE